jgi:hypothetical protein
MTTALHIVTWLALGTGAVVLGLFLFARRR